MALPKPSSYLDWTPNAALRQEPTAGEKAAGWAVDQRPPSKFFNWVQWLLDQWVKYLESVTDESALARVDAIVDKDGNGTHTTLQAAHDDSNVQAGSTILIVSDLFLNATVSITKPDIEIRMQPGKRFKKGGSAPATNFTGVSVGATAKRIRMMSCAFGSATGAEKFGGAGDKALAIDVAASNVFLFNPQFVAGNTQDLDDQSTTTAITAPQAGLPQ